MPAACRGFRNVYMHWSKHRNLTQNCNFLWQCFDLSQWSCSPVTSQRQSLGSKIRQQKAVPVPIYSSVTSPGSDTHTGTQDVSIHVAGLCGRSTDTWFRRALVKRCCHPFMQLPRGTASWSSTAPQPLPASAPTMPQWTVCPVVQVMHVPQGIESKNPLFRVQPVWWVNAATARKDASCLGTVSL